MARFAIYSNGKKLETIEDLKENFTLKDMVNNFRTKSLHRWLAEKGLRDELQRIENIPSDGDISILLMECFTLSEEQKAAVKQRAEDDAKRIQEEQKAEEKREKEAFTDEKSGYNLIDIPMPEFSSNDQKVLLASWRVQVGDRVKKGDIFCEVETGKATIEVESQFEGVVSEILVQAGDDVPVSTTILRLEPSNEILTSDTGRVDVFFIKGSDEHKIEIIKEMRLATDCDLKTAKDTYESNSPALIVQNIGKDAAEIIKRRIERLGGAVSLNNSQYSQSFPSDAGYDVILQNYPPANKIAVIRELRTFTLSDDLKRAKELAEAVPNVTIAADVSIEAAKMMKRILSGSGIDGNVVINEREHSNQAKLVVGFSSSSPFVQNKEKQNSQTGSNAKTIDRVAAVVKQIIGHQLAINPLEIKDSDDIIADLGADEDDIREMQWSINQEFDANFDYLTNVGQIIACIKRR